MKLRIARILFGALVLTIGGCGYQQSGMDHENTNGYQWHSLYRQDIQTVAVPVFTNVSYRHGLEVSLTKAVIQQIEENTPYKVVSSQKADTILEGQITTAQVTTLSNDPYSGLPQEQLFTITVAFTWKNLRTGQELVRRSNFDQRATFFPTLGEGTDVGSQSAIDSLALGIVRELQADW